MTLKPGAIIGIIGGGQLGRMLAIAAGRLGYGTIVLDPQENSPAFQFANAKILAEYDDENALRELASTVDVITYEFENVPVNALQVIEADNSVHPNTKALSTSQDRLVEKTFFNNLGISTAPFFNVESADDLNDALKKLGNKGILKTRRMGYDGKGQVRVRLEDAGSLKVARELTTTFPCILEGFVDFEREISVIATRGIDGRVSTFDLGENVHKEGILHTTTIPAKVSETTTKRANEIAHTVLTALNYVGVIGIEFFVLSDGSILVNEFAPRVHNSGHWTEAACAVSQFEQHIRAVTGNSLGSTARHSDCIMENLIGEDMLRAPEILKMPDTHLHLYGKRQMRPGRKMGHFTALSSRKS